MTRRKALVVTMVPVVLAVAVLGFINRQVLWDLLFVDYAQARYGMVTSASGAVLREEPRIDSPRILALKPGSVVSLVGETSKEEKIARLGKAKWFKVKTRSQDVGYCFGTLIAPLARDKALSLIHRDYADFEDELRKLIEDKAREAASVRHPASRVDDVRLLTPLRKQSNASFDVRVSALTTGSLLGINKHRVDLSLNLDLEVDLNYLSKSRMRVRDVDILSDTKTDGLSAKEVVNLAQIFAPAAGFGF